MKQKGLAPILIVLLVALGLGGYFIYQKQKPTAIPQQVVQTTSTPSSNPESSSSVDIANWKIYTNTGYSYSIKYPSDFRTQVQAAGAGVKEAPTNARSLYIYDSKLKLEEQYLSRFIDIDILVLEPIITAEVKKSEVYIAGIKATKFEYPAATSSFVEYHITLANNKGILIIQVSNMPDKQELANQILSTFKFTQ